MWRFVKYFLVVLILFWAYDCGSDKGELDVYEEIAKLKVMPASKIYKLMPEKNLMRKIRSLDSIFEYLKVAAGFNGTVLYAENERVVYHKAFGYANPVKKQDAIATDGQFELASVSKMFTATAILILKEQGKIKLDADIKEYIPEWNYEGISIRHLLTHRSGLPRYEYLADEYWPDHSRPMTNGDMIQMFVKNKPEVYFKPDNGFHYCNTNYALLATVVENVSKMPFRDFMEANIFKPAGMKNSFIYHLPPDSLVNGYRNAGIPGYDQHGRRLVRVANDHLNGVVGDKGMFSTVLDLYHFDLALNHEILLKKETLREAYSPGSPSKRNRKDNYGFGWRIHAESDSAVYHYGWWKGYRSFFLRDLAHKKTLIVLTNKSSAPGSEHFWDIINDRRYPVGEASAYTPVEFRLK